MCGGYGDTDGDGKSDGIGAFLTDITDGGGPGRSGARFSSRDTGGLDLNQDNYISEQEYQRGQSNSESNADSGITGEIGDAYNNSRGVISNFSNSFGALPRGSIRQEAALGPQYGTPIETKNMVRYLQMGGMPGTAIRGVSGFLGGAADAAGDMAMAPIRAYRGEGAPPDPVVTPEQAARSYDSIFNTGSSQFDKLPEDRRDAIIRGTRSLNPRAVSVPVPVPETLYYDDDPYSNQRTNANLKDKVVFENGMYNFYENGQLVRQITEQEYNQMLMNPYRTA
jgi:hypothetical protein